MKWGIIILAMCAVLVPTVFAGAINVSSCSFNQTASLCGEYVEMRCTVNDSTTATAVNQVRFKYEFVGGDEFTGLASVKSGSNKNGVYVVSVMLSKGMANGSGFKFKGAEVVNSKSEICSGNDILYLPAIGTEGEDSCHINVRNSTGGYPQQVPVTCVCTRDILTYYGCFKDVNHSVREVSYGCPEYPDVQNLTGNLPSCNSCDTQFVTTYGGCVPTQGGLGISYAQSLPSNTACCELTGLDSDCHAASDGSVRECVIDNWYGYGKEGDASFKSSNISYYEGLNYTLYNATGSYGFQPLFFDVSIGANEGERAIIAQKGDGSLDVRYPNMVGIVSVPTGGTRWIGQASLYGWSKGTEWKTTPGGDEEAPGTWTETVLDGYAGSAVQRNTGFGSGGNAFLLDGQGFLTSENPAVSVLNQCPATGYPGECVSCQLTSPACFGASCKCHNWWNTVPFIGFLGTPAYNYGFGTRVLGGWQAVSANATVSGPTDIASSAIPLEVLDSGCKQYIEFSVYQKNASVNAEIYAYPNPGANSSNTWLDELPDDIKYAVAPSIGWNTFRVDVSEYSNWVRVVFSSFFTTQGGVSGVANVKRLKWCPTGEAREIEVNRAVGVAGIVNKSGTKMVFYTRDPSTSGWVSARPDVAVNVSEGAGVRCEGEYCFFVRSDASGQYLGRVNAGSNADPIYKYLRAGPGFAFNVTPVIVSVNGVPAGVAVRTASSSGVNPQIYVCPLVFYNESQCGVASLSTFIDNIGDTTELVAVGESTYNAQYPWRGVIMMGAKAGVGAGGTRDVWRMEFDGAYIHNAVRSSLTSQVFNFSTNAAVGCVNTSTLGWGMFNYGGGGGLVCYGNDAWLWPNSTANGDLERLAGVDTLNYYPRPPGPTQFNCSASRQRSCIGDTVRCSGTTCYALAGNYSPAYFGEYYWDRLTVMKTDDFRDGAGSWYSLDGVLPVSPYNSSYNLSSYHLVAYGVVDGEVVLVLNTGNVSGNGSSPKYQFSGPANFVLLVSRDKGMNWTILLNRTVNNSWYEMSEWGLPYSPPNWYWSEVLDCRSQSSLMGRVCVFETSNGTGLFNASRNTVHAMGTGNRDLRVMKINLTNYNYTKIPSENLGFIGGALNPELGEIAVADDGVYVYSLDWIGKNSGSEDIDSTFNFISNSGSVVSVCSNPSGNLTNVCPFIGGLVAKNNSVYFVEVPVPPQFSSPSGFDNVSYLMKNDNFAVLRGEVGAGNYSIRYSKVYSRKMQAGNWVGRQNVSEFLLKNTYWPTFWKPLYYPYLMKGYFDEQGGYYAVGDLSIIYMNSCCYSFVTGSMNDHVVPVGVFVRDEIQDFGYTYNSSGVPCFAYNYYANVSSPRFDTSCWIPRAPVFEVGGLYQAFYGFNDVSGAVFYFEARVPGMYTVFDIGDLLRVCEGGNASGKVYCVKKDDLSVVWFKSFLDGVQSKVLSFLDFNGGDEDIVFIGKVFDGQNSSVMGDVGSSVAMHLNTDKQFDFMSVTAAGLQTLLSEEGASSAPGEGLSATSFECEYIRPGLIRASWEGLVSSGNALEFTYESDTKQVVTSESFYSFCYTQEAEYVVNGVVRDPITGERLEDSCSANVLVASSCAAGGGGEEEGGGGDVTPPPSSCNVNEDCNDVCKTCVNHACVDIIGCGSEPPIAGCTVGYDGEFNYNGALSGQNWQVLSGASPIANGSVAQAAGIGAVTYPLSCAQTQMGIEMRLRTSDSMIVEVRNNQTSRIGAIQIEGGVLFVWAQGGRQAIGGVSSANFVNVSVYFYEALKEMRIVVDGVDVGAFKYETSTANGFGALLWRVISCSGTCVAEADYIRFGAFVDYSAAGGGTGSVRVLPQEYVQLTRCDSNGTNVGLNYSAVKAYCDVLGGREYVCSIYDLQKAVKFNTRCFKEALNYCVYKTYPETSGFSGVEEERLQTRGVEGGFSCMASLSVGVTMDRIVIPTWGVVWNLVLTNVMLVLFVIVVVIGVFLVGRRR